MRDSRIPAPAGGEPTSRESRATEPGDGAQALLRTIEGELVPRLMLAHSSQHERAERVDGAGSSVTSEDRARMMDAVLRDSPAASREVLEDLRQRRVPEEAVLLDLLAYAARRLGELWEADQCDFTTVTIGLCRLHALLREQGLPTEGFEASAAGNAPRILLANVPGDQHVFGIVMVSEFFRKAGWGVSIEPGATAARLTGLVGEERFDLVGLSAACSTPPQDLRSQIEALRSTSIWLRRSCGAPPGTRTCGSSSEDLCSREGPIWFEGSGPTPATSTHEPRPTRPRAC